MMPAHPTFASAVYVSLLAYPATRYAPGCWLTNDGEPNGSVDYSRDRLRFTIQGTPTALRELAAALVAAAELAEQIEPPVPLTAATSPSRPLPQ